MNTATEAARAASSTIRYYDAHAASIEQESFPAWVDEPMCAFADQLPENPLMLDVGCGFGRLVPVLRDIGVRRYIGVDKSSGMLALARRNYPDDDFREGDIRDLKQVVPEKCDAFFCAAVLMQIPRSDAQKVFGSIRSVMAKGAAGYITTPLGVQTIVVDRKKRPELPRGHKFLIEQWTLESLEPIVTRCGFEVTAPTFTLEGMLHLTLRAV